jgi:hypothetical protein
MTSPPDFRQHLEVETPEHVVLDYEIAGLGSRALAAIIDTALLMVWLIALSVMMARFVAAFGEWVLAILTLLGLRLVLLHLLKAQTTDRQTQRASGGVDTGHAVTFAAVAGTRFVATSPAA